MELIGQAVSGNTAGIGQGSADVDEQNTEAAAVIECHLTGVVIDEIVTVEQDPFAVTEEEAEDAEFE